MKLSPGMRFDRYVVERMLGQGGMAEVWAARHMVLGSLHVLKVLTRTSPDLYRRLLSEGRAQAQLDHPNILAVRDVLDLHGRPVLVMPLVQGPSLYTFLRDHRLSHLQALALFRLLVQAMAFAHRQGFIHRDLKPANILLDAPFGLLRPRIADFGLVKEDNVHQTQSGAVFGTPAYAAPEQLRDASNVDARADLFSLGVILVELLTETRPFHGTSLPEIIAAHRGPPNFGEMPERYYDLASKLLEVNPDERMASCEALLHALPELSVELLSAPGALLAQESQHSENTIMHSETMARSGVWGSSHAPPTDTGITAVPQPPSIVHNLPPRRTPLFGRRTEIRTLIEKIADGDRLITLVGAAGLGKSRLAIEIARTQLEQSSQDWPGGVWFVPLSEASAAGGICSAVAEVLGVRLNQDPAQQLAWVIEGRGRMLVILDNFEQLVEHAPSTVGRWLDAAPQAQWVVTSRETLRLKGEHVVHLDLLNEEDAIAMFTDHARRVNQHFTLNEADRQIVRQLVHLLDRLPLAIELAAARSRTLSPGNLLRRLSQRFKLLKSQAQDQPPRQRTLLDSLEWSWDLLNEDERAVLCQCGLFQGGISLEAAAAILTVQDDRVWVEEVLNDLVDKSLLVANQPTPAKAVRLTMLLSIQQFAARQLTTYPGRTTLLERHGDYFAGFHYAHTTPNLLFEERDNLIVAAQGLMDREQYTKALHCCRSIITIFMVRGPYAEGAEIMESLCRSTLSEAHQAFLRGAIGYLWLMSGTLDRATQHSEAALILAQRADDPEILAHVHGYVGLFRHHQGRMSEAEGHYQRALSLIRQVKNSDREDAYLGGLGVLNKDLGRLDEAEKYLRQAIDVSPRNTPTERLGWHLGSLGDVHHGRGQLDEAMSFYQRALEMGRQVGDRSAESARLMSIASLNYRQGRVSEAITQFNEALTISREIGQRRFMPPILQNIGFLSVVQGEFAIAEEHYLRALQISQQIGSAENVGASLGGLAVLYQKQDRLDTATTYAQRALNIAKRLGNQRQEGHWLGTLGRLAQEQGNLQEAEDAFEQAVRVQEKIGDRSRQAAWLKYLGVLAVQQHELARGRARLQHSLRLLREINEPPEQLEVLCQLIQLEVQDNQLDAARQRYEEACQIVEKIELHLNSELTALFERTGAMVLAP